MAEGSLSVLKREETGKQVSKHLRLTGNIPGVLYGTGIDPTPLTIDKKELSTLLHSLGRNAVVNLSIGKSKKKIKSFIYEIQHDPISGDITHIDLKQISMDEKIHVTVPIHLTGTAYGVKNEGGIVEHMLHAIDISCLPSDIPETIELDITDLHLGDVIHVGDLPSGNFEMLTGMESVIVHIIAPKVVKVEEEAEEEVIVEEGEITEPEIVGGSSGEGQED